ncbi:hypothetical protein HELRODRAFT_82008 [Helobdella robusta]|uniref:RRM domain-containing protein n=1 Tax=Helobdella robusta TaxID=6412 RepID=T1G4L8_HELRO|nr:hypothetical protein HELRODRAFT_82008 [Helobdella robusta]ESO01402.1 hypothetical protein HELRODRAFT_82008 [Helobdella robusta]
MVINRISLILLFIYSLNPSSIHHVITSNHSLNQSRDTPIRSGDKVEDDCVTKARGLPWRSTEMDVANFFCGLNIKKGGIVICMSSEARKNGEVMVHFDTPTDRNLSIKRHKHHLGGRYIEVYKSSARDFLGALSSNGNKVAQRMLIEKYELLNPVIIRMRGLPYTCKPIQVVEFFKQEPNSCSILDEEDGVLFVYHSEGRNTGDAFVLLANEEEGAKALKKHKQCIGARYIELFKSTTAEVQQVRFRLVSEILINFKNYHIRKICLECYYMMIQVVVAINIDSVMDCLHIVGTPPDATVNDIVHFLADHAKDIRHKGVHLVYNCDGTASGEAFIEMVGEKQAESSATNKHKKMMLVSSRRHIVGVFVCSFDDIAMHLCYGTLYNQLKINYINDGCCTSEKCTAGVTNCIKNVNVTTTAVSNTTNTQADSPTYEINPIVPTNNNNIGNNGFIACNNLANYANSSSYISSGSGCGGGGRCDAGMYYVDGGSVVMMSCDWPMVNNHVTCNPGTLLFTLR